MNYKLFIVKLVRPIYRKINKAYDIEWKRVESEIERLSNNDLPINILELKDAYDDTYFSAQQFELEKKYIPSICRVIYSVLKPKTLVDFGCGQGQYLSYFSSKGVIIKGFEGSDSAFSNMAVSKKYIIRQDLRRVMKSPRRSYELAISFEVAEHIEKEFAGIYLYNLTNHSDSILFTAFPPGIIDPHPHHPNEQNIEYWIELFTFYGYKLNTTVTNQIQEKLKEIKLPQRLRQYENMYFFQKS